MSKELNNFILKGEISRNDLSDGQAMIQLIFYNNRDDRHSKPISLFAILYARTITPRHPR